MYVCETVYKFKKNEFLKRKRSAITATEKAVIAISL